MPTTLSLVPKAPLPQPTLHSECSGTSDRCAFSHECLSTGYRRNELEALHGLVEHMQEHDEGKHLFRRGEPFRAIYAVRSGCVKTSIYSRDGREQVLGFYLPGEVVGLNAIYPDCYPCDAIALESTTFCRFSFPAMSRLAAEVPVVQNHLFRLLSRELGMASMLAGDHTADERVAAFLLDLGERQGRREHSTTVFHFPMSRSDMANYLRLAPETVSRVLSRFRDRGWVDITGRHARLRDPVALREVGAPLLQAAAAG
ncbi:Crp/Fnr family transcriptional regulator [Dyella solisilvae]|uniref:CRP-like protein Clp n=1 Tax=Dyella solisilvae TaxID=1920168 RepID=A0A370K446_9GAMM|nr:Crp/Fnr family transcriptional regulator [Dyella solisilvae]RDI97378.1 Crp/Fnr family transcriptional regulator [Dyella solisilvae]